MTEWLPKEQRKKILFLSDDMRVPTGIGVMTREIIEQTSGYFNWVQVAAAIKHPEEGKIVDMSQEIAKTTGVEDPSVILYPSNGYGNSMLVRHLLEKEKPDAILIFTDPRYWIWLFQIEHEIRKNIPLMFYNIWDGGWTGGVPAYPKYNRNYYRSCDALFAISKQTYAVNKCVLGLENVYTKKGTDNTEPKVMLAYIPHGVDHKKKYFPITEDMTESVELLNKVKEQTFKSEDINFVVFYNARNLRRKMTPDTILAYNHFLQQLPKEEQEKCRLVMHTHPVDDNGTDLPAVINDLTPDVKVIFSATHVEPNVLNALYNLADVTINLASNEGFGLGTCESLLAGTPILVNVTGGLQDQCGFKNDNGEYLDPEKDFTFERGSNHDGRFRNHGEWAFPVFPVSISLQGSPLTPYIFDDRCDWKEVGNKLLEIYRMGRTERKRLGLLGREFAMGSGMMTAEKMGEQFIENIDNVLQNWTPRKRYTLIKA